MFFFINNLLNRKNEEMYNFGRDRFSDRFTIRSMDLNTIGSIEME